MEYREHFQKKWAQLKDDFPLDNGLFLRLGPGHTRKVADYAQVHEGRPTAQYYAAATWLGVLDEKSQLEILRALAQLQDRDPNSRFYGGFRWYSEEDFIEDTNAAFFITMPLLELVLYHEEKIPASNLPILREIFKLALCWFQRECTHPSNYYPNKVLSDGAALCALSCCLKDSSAKRTALSFVAQWARYTVERGWGWGEHISPVYSEIVLDALYVILRVLRQWQEPLEHIQALYQHIIDIAAFHGEYEYVPAIRSYNFEGCDDRGFTTLSYKARLEDRIPERINEVQEGRLSLVPLILCCFLYGGDRPAPKLQTEAVRIERIFDSACSYTWKGKNLRMGSLNHFPVMPGCYQHPDWGLGWQSMPVSFLVEGAQTGYLRFGVQDGETLRTHPARDYHTAYLSSGLFSEKYLPAVRTNCTQNENVLVATRTIEKVHNYAEMIEDAWVVHHFHGRVEEIGGWKCLIYNNCSLAIQAVGGYTTDGCDIGNTQTLVQIQEDTLFIKKALYEGSAAVLDAERLECQWVVIAFDGVSEPEVLKELLSNYRITDEYVPDYDIPRDAGWLNKVWDSRMTKVFHGERLLLEHCFDPMQGIRS